MRLPGCVFCEEDGCCPEHCCDWDNCDCECSAGRERYAQPSALADSMSMQHCSPCMEEEGAPAEETIGLTIGPAAMPPKMPRPSGQFNPRNRLEGDSMEEDSSSSQTSPT